MELLSQIEARESAAREKAWRHERLLDERARLEKSLTHLTAMALDGQALTIIRDQLANVPAGLTTKSSTFFAGGFNVRDLLTELVEGGLAEVTVKAQKRNEAIVTTERKLAQVRKALQDFEVTA